MIVSHLLIGLTAGILAALAAWAAGWPLWAMLGAYMLGGNVGAAVSAGVAWWRPGRSCHPGREEAAIRPGSDAQDRV